MCVNPVNSRHDSSIKVPCGKCQQCHSKYIQHWIFRCKQQLKAVNYKACFLTLTYNWDNLPCYGVDDVYHIDDTITDLTQEEVNVLYELNKNKVPSYMLGRMKLNLPDVQKFIKRMRKEIAPRNFTYICAGEYGEKNKRPHYHLLLFGLDKEDFDLMYNKWALGDIHIGTVTEASIAYTFKYSIKEKIKRDELGLRKSFNKYSPFVVMSKGIGEDWAYDINKVSKQITIKKTGKVVTRMMKDRTPKNHFISRVKNISNGADPFLTIDRHKMSIPKFYLKCMFHNPLYDSYMSSVKQQNEDNEKEKISKLYFANMENRYLIQAKYAYKSFYEKNKYTLSKEKL